MSILLLPMAAPLPLMVAALLSIVAKSQRPRLLLTFAEAGAILALALSLGTIGFLAVQGPGTSPLIGASGIGLSLRLDVLSTTMSILVSFVGWIVIRYSGTYLDGEVRQTAFTGWTCCLIALVLLLVQSGNLVQLCVCWISVSFCLHKLLLFYPERVNAFRAARKKMLFSSIGALALLAGALVLALSHRTTDIAAIDATIREAGAGPLTSLAAALLAAAALLKSAQFPTHGWLTEVMEAPTPVSALLHAGVINAGGFLLIRFADLMVAAPGVLAALAIVGGFTALFGAVVMLTQPAVKTALAWSTVAQMGFMVLQCGLALFPLALLHIVAHSLYKAHAFLASGGAVDLVAASRRPGPIAVPNGWAVGRALLAALTIYTAVTIVLATVFGPAPTSPQAMALGAILIFGVAFLLAQGLADAAPAALTRKMAFYAVAAAIGYFALQTAAEWLTQGTLPPTPAPGRLEWTLMIVALLSFGLVAVAQMLMARWSAHSAVAGIRVHLSNGLYVSAALDRFLGAWSVRKLP